MIYFDNAATTFPKPEETVRAMNAAMRCYGANPGRSGHRLSLVCAEKVYECRERAARLFGCPQPENVVFTANCTHSVNLVINSLVPGGHAVISDIEHNAVLRVSADAAEGEPGTICEVLQTGYRVKGRMLRHPMVKVIED